MATILVVDDSGYARRLLRRTLEGAGHAVLEAPSGMAGLESYAIHQPDVVMLDLTMDDMGGLEVLQRLQEMDAAVPVIVVSADVQRSTTRLVEQSGAFRFLGKPAEPEDVLDAVRAALGEAAR